MALKISDDFIDSTIDKFMQSRPYGCSCLLGIGGNPDYGVYTFTLLYETCPLHKNLKPGEQWFGKSIQEA